MNWKKSGAIGAAGILVGAVIALATPLPAMAGFNPFFEEFPCLFTDKIIFTSTKTLRQFSEEEPFIDKTIPAGEPIVIWAFSENPFEMMSQTEQILKATDDFGITLNNGNDVKPRHIDQVIADYPAIACPDFSELIT